ncbi:MAG: Lrp/AsnC family transcriptional regulator [Methyloligellaceae bacterium]
MLLSKADHKILNILQEDGRIPLTSLAEKAGMSTTTCGRRVAALEEAGIIEGYSARINQTSVGLPISAFISVELERQEGDLITRFENYVATLDEVMDCYLMTGSQDFLLRVVVKDLSGYERFLQEKLTQAPGVRSVRSRFALRKSVDRHCLPLWEP